QALETGSPHIPMPGGDPDPGARVFQGLVLQPRRVQVELPPQGEQALAIRAHEVHHRLPSECVAVKPNAAVEGEAPTLAAACELPVGGRYWQAMRPSIVAGGGAVAGQENTEHRGK